MATVQIPDFDFSAFYYQQILEALILFKRRDCPEITDESDCEPYIQLLRSMALVGHLNNVVADLIANESTLSTAKLPETIRNMLRLIAYELKPATPSAADIVFELNRVFASGTMVVPTGAQLATQRTTSETPVVTFEVATAQSTVRTDKYGAVYAKNTDGSFEDHTVDANAGTPFAVWSLPVGPGSELYFGHEDVMWDQIDVASSGGGSIVIGVWEFYDGEVNDDKPSAVTNMGGGVLQFDLTNLLGQSKRSGAEVTVTYSKTGTQQVVISEWNGTNNVVNTGLLGQGTPSTSVEDYIVGVSWQEVANVTDNTLRLNQSGKAIFDLPQDLTRNWKKAAVNGFFGFFIRFRVVEINNDTTPTLSQCLLDTGKQYMIAQAVQGRTSLNEVLGSSNGEPNQRFDMKQPHFISKSESVFVDNVQWIRVNDFLSSTFQDTHYTVELGEDDRATVIFGDGKTGKIPPIGQANITASYRFNAEENGNVGSNTINVDKTGLSFVSKVNNPRPAVGWADAQAATPEGLALAKIEGPSTLRTKTVAISPEDMEELAVAFVSADGSKPFSRAKAIEEGFGPKTTRLVVVGRGSVVPLSGQLAELETYMNGDRNADPPKPKHIVANQQAIPVSFTPRPIDIVARVKAPPTVTPQEIVNFLVQVFQPTALEPDGVTFVWSFSDEIPDERINHEIFNSNSLITAVDMTVPSGDLQLGTEELPVPGNIVITVVQEF